MKTMITDYVDDEEQREIEETLSNLSNEDLHFNYKDISNEDFLEYDIKKINGQKDLYRLRIGKDRAIYTIIQDKLVTQLSQLLFKANIY